ncbi:MAG: hypothetical protein IJM82_04680 [Synergistaceae bacterium]|nr:hypothetical protein [Synergistaceae bacterium]MBR0251780.1 hypothetical protein [Synergistaceae bacterium]
MNNYSKCDLRLELRGRLDSLNAQIILFQAYSQNQEYISDLEDVRKVIRILQRSEAAEKVFDGKLILFGIDEDEIHKRSHNPEKFYGLGHVMPHYEMKKEAAELNFLRTLVREVELCSCKVFENDELKINHVLNRLSSALYILTYKYLPDSYDKTIKF